MTSTPAVWQLKRFISDPFIFRFSRIVLQKLVKYIFCATCDGPEVSDINRLSPVLRLFPKHYF